MAKVYLYDWKEKKNVAESSYLEPIAIAALASAGKYEVVVKDLDELIEIDDDSIFNRYVPEPKQIDPIKISSAYGWNYQLWVTGRLIWSGSFDASILEDAFSASKHGNVDLVIWPIESGGLPMGTNSDE